MKNRIRKNHKPLESVGMIEGTSGRELSCLMKLRGCPRHLVGEK